MSIEANMLAKQFTLSNVNANMTGVSENMEGENAY